MILVRIFFFQLKHAVVTEYSRSVFRLEFHCLFLRIGFAFVERADRLVVDILHQVDVLLFEGNLAAPVRHEREEAVLAKRYGEQHHQVERDDGPHEHYAGVLD